MRPTATRSEKPSRPRKLRILHITKGGGGLDVYIANILHHLPAQEFEQTVICSRDHGNLFAICEQAEVPVHHLPIGREISPTADLSLTFALIAQIRRTRPDIVHLHSSKAGAIGRPACLLAGVPCIYTPHAAAYLGMKGLKRKIFILIESALAPITRLILANSRSEMISLQQDLFIPAREFSYFFNSINIEPLSQIARETPPSPGVHIVTLARLIDQKNPHMIVRTAERVIREIPEAVFHIIGAGLDDFLGEEITRAIQERGLSDRIIIHPWMSRPQALEMVAGSTLAIATSVFESFGYFVAEAQILSKAVVATDILGVKDIVQDGETGYLVPSHDDAAMAEKILQLIRHPDLRNKMGQHGAAEGARRFSIQTNISQLADIYIAALAHPPSRTELQESPLC